MTEAIVTFTLIHWLDDCFSFEVVERSGAVTYQSHTSDCPLYETQKEAESAVRSIHKVIAKSRGVSAQYLPFEITVVRKKAQTREKDIAKAEKRSIELLHAHTGLAAHYKSRRSRVINRSLASIASIG